MDDDAEPVNFSSILRGAYERRAPQQGTVHPSPPSRTEPKPVRDDPPPVRSEISEALRAGRAAGGVQFFDSNSIRK